MRASRLLATLLTILGAGLVSGSLAQVAALDGDLERAARERDRIERVHFVSQRCPRERPAPAEWRES